MKTAEENKSPIAKAIDQINEAGNNFPGIGFSDDYIDGLKKGIQLASFILKGKYLSEEREYASYIAEEVLKRAADKVEIDLDGLEEPVFDSRDGDLIRARNEGIKLSNETACVTILNTEYKDLLK